MNGKRKTSLFIFTSTLLLSACGGRGGITAFELNRVSKNMVEGESFQLEIAKMEGGKAPVTYSSSNPSVAIVSEDGKITALQVGEAKILANCDSLQASCLVSVTKKILDSPVKQRAGMLSLDLNCPSQNVVGSFHSAFSLYEEESSKEIVLPFGQGEKGRANVELVKDLALYLEGDGSSLAASYAALLEDPTSDVSEETLHLGSLPPNVFYAFLTKQSQARKYASKPFDLTMLDPLLEVMNLPSFNKASLEALDWKTILDSLGAKSGLDKAELQKLKTMELEIYMAVVGHYQLDSLDQEDATTYSLSFDDAGLKGLSSFLSRHKTDFHLKGSPKLTKANASLIHPKDGNLLSSMEIDLGFTEQDVSNSAHLIVTLSPEITPAPDDHFLKLEEQVAAWEAK